MLSRSSGVCYPNRFNEYSYLMSGPCSMSAAQSYFVNPPALEFPHTSMSTAWALSLITLTNLHQLGCSETVQTFFERTAKNLLT